MNHNDVKYGIKVAPHSKSARWGDLESSKIWKGAVKNGRPYLFVVRFDKDEGAFVLSYNDPNIYPNLTGEYFKASDFDPYIEPDQEEPMVNKPDNTPANPFEPTLDQPLPFNPKEIDPITSLPCVFAFDSATREWNLCYFMGYDRDNDTFEVIFKESRKHKQVKYISAYGVKTPIHKSVELLEAAKRNDFSLTFDGTKWVLSEIRDSRHVADYDATLPWLYSIRA